MLKTIFWRRLLSVLMVATVAACGAKEPEAKTTHLTGAGATFPAPYYTILMKDFAKKHGIDITYGATGSGSGIRSLKEKTVDFGATDVFLSDKELAEMPAKVVHIPTCMGGIVLAFNLDKVKDLKLTSDVIAAIFTGQITHWQDARIAAINPNVALPDQKITVVYRSDGSGSTAVFSQYMSEVSPQWQEKIGQGKSLNFPVGVAAKGNPGVAGVIRETPGAIGYIGSEYAFALNIPTAALKNAAGEFVHANLTSIAAAANADMPADTRATIVNSKAKGAYPIATLTWLITWQTQESSSQRQALQKFFHYALSEDAKETAAKTHYAPLPESLRQQALNVVDSINTTAKP